MSCSCNDFDNEGHATKLARDEGARVGARLDPAAARALVTYCANNSCSTSEGIRRALVTLGAQPGGERGKSDALADLCRVLGLAPGSDAKAILEAVSALVGDAPGTPPEDFGASAENADPSPVERARGYAAARGTALTTRAGAPRVRSVPLTVAERVYCERNKITPEQFAARKRNAVRRLK